MVASKRLPASAPVPVSTGWPLYQSCAVPEARPPLEQVRRAETRNCNWAPGGRGAGPFSVRLIVFSMLALKAPAGLLTLSNSPVPTSVLLMSTSAFKSSFSPVSPLLAPTQTFAGESAVKSLEVGVFVGVGVCVGAPVGVFVGVLVGVRVGVLVGALVGVFVGVFVGAPVGVFVGVGVGVPQPANV